MGIVVQYNICSQWTEIDKHYQQRDGDFLRSLDHCAYF